LPGELSENNHLEDITDNLKAGSEDEIKRNKSS
jgi:hypothetical protein